MREAGREYRYTDLGTHAWALEELEWHRCPCCGNECPPLPPMHDRPTVKEAIESLRQQLRAPHRPSCQMDGQPGYAQGSSTTQGTFMCDCSMRGLYRTMRRLQQIFDEPDDE